MIKKLEFRASIAPIMSGIRTGGDGIRLTLDIPESDVQDAVALIALRNTPLRITVEVDDSLKGKVERPAETPSESPSTSKTKKPKKEKGPHSRYWQAMFIAGFQNMRDLQSVLSLSDTVDVKQAVKNLFGVESITFISPADFEAWAETRQLHQLISMSRQASARLQEMT